MSIGGSGNTTKASIPGAEALISGVLAPQLPQWDPKWDLNQYHVEQERFNRALLEYIRRLNGRIATSIIQQITNITTSGVTQFRYDATSHKFQVLINGTWTDASGTQPTSVANVQTDTAYSTSTHILSKDRVASVYVLEKGSATTGTAIETAVPDSD